MSLINDMLRDLDARRQPPGGLDALALQGVGPSLAAHASVLPLGRLLLVIGLAVGLAAAGVYVWAPGNPVVPETAPPLAPSSPPVQVASAPVLAEAVSPVPQETPGETRDTHALGAEAAPREPLPKAPLPVVAHKVPAAVSSVPATPADTASVARTRVRTLTPAEQAQQAFEQGAAALRQEQPRRAEDLLREALALQPGHSEARLALASLQLRLQRPAEALALLAAGLALEPQSVELARLRGHLLLQQDRLQEARRVLETAAPGASERADYQALLGTLYQRLGAHEQAVNHYRQALGLQPDQCLWWMGLGVSLEQTHQGGAAREAFRTALGYSLSPALQQYIQGRLTALGR
jgi:MSHA biogenesis protein MshN